jgi:hypothetical protein
VPFLFGVLVLDRAFLLGAVAVFAVLAAVGDDLRRPLTAIAQLRKKLEADPTRPRHLLTEAGMRYRFMADLP